MTEKRRNIWFRMHSEVLDDPKVQRLHPTLFKAWINLLCLACRGDGLLPSSINDIAFALRASEHDAQGYIDELVMAELIDIRTDGRFTPHNWCNRQFVSDTSAERVRKHRERKKKEARNADVTLPETPPYPDPDPESESDKQKNPDPDPDTAERTTPGDVKGLVQASLGRGRGGVVSIEARRKVAARLAIANADPLIALYDAWPNSQWARDPDGLFISIAARLYREATPEVRTACQPLADARLPDAPLPAVRPSSTLVATLNRRNRHAVPSH